MSAKDNLKQQCLLLGVLTYDSVPAVSKFLGERGSKTELSKKAVNLNPKQKNTPSP
jgi:hypothetical protein